MWNQSSSTPTLGAYHHQPQDPSLPSRIRASESHLPRNFSSTVGTSTPEQHQSARLDPSIAERAAALKVPFLDYDAIRQKQDSLEKLLKVGKLEEAITLKEEVDMDIQAHRQMVFAEKNRRIKVAILIQEDAIRLLKKGAPTTKSLTVYGTLFARAINREIMVNGVGLDLLLPESQFERLAKKLRVTSQLLEAVFLESTSNISQTHVAEMGKYFEEFRYPTCLNHGVFSQDDIPKLGFRPHPQNIYTQQQEDDTIAIDEMNTDKSREM
ncbi:hypothetical protein AA313_de0202896 [Arthrobotrys entomopaga]|nr:hypothetical protein AA313_de0202896 [Arthrobotrys entomopaga]